MFAWHGVLPPYSIPGMPLAGQEINGRFEPGMLVYGVPIGTGQYVESMKEVKTEEIVKEAMQACKVLAEENQSLWTTLRLSTQQKLAYWLMLLHPTHVQTAAANMDSILWQMLEEVVGAHLPRQQEGLGYNKCLDVPVQALSAKSFQSWVAQMPIRLGGLEIRCQSDISPIAYIGALEQSLPHFGGENGI